MKFIYSEKATNFCEISTVDLSYVVTVKSTVEISQNFVAFSEYMNFNKLSKFLTSFIHKISIPLVSGKVPVWMAQLIFFSNTIFFKGFVKIGKNKIIFKGQLNSEWIDEVIEKKKMQA